MMLRGTAKLLDASLTFQRFQSKKAKNTFRKYTDPTAHHPFELKSPIEVEMEMLMNVCFVSLTYLCINTPSH